MSDFQRKFFMENYRRESALNVARRNASKTPSEPFYWISTYQQTARGDQSGEVSSTEEQLSIKERESLKLEESTENAKPRPMGHQQIL